jgi:hypothetical protein
MDDGSDDILDSDRVFGWDAPSDRDDPRLGWVLRLGMIIGSGGFLVDLNLPLCFTNFICGICDLLKDFSDEGRHGFDVDDRRLGIVETQRRTLIWCLKLDLVALNPRTRCIRK